MNLQKLTIGQMAEMNHVSEQTLRLYDRKGLLRPQSVDRVTGYRYYHITQSARLDLIQNLKLYGMTLQQIKTILEEHDAGSLQRLLTRQTQAVEEKIRKLEHSLTAINRMVENYKRYEAMPQNGEIFIEFIPERYIYRYNCGINYFDQDQSGYEYMLRKLKHHIADQGIPFSYFCNVGTTIRRERLLAGELYSDEVFFFAEQVTSMDNLETLPAGAYVCLCSSEFSHEADNVRRLMDYITAHDCQILGDYLCEVIIDFLALDFEHRKVFYKTQIPVRFR